MSNPRTFKHTPKEEREAQRRRQRGERRAKRRATAGGETQQPAKPASRPARGKAAPDKGARAAARRPGASKQGGGVGVLPWILGGVGLLALILILAIAAGGDSTTAKSSGGMPQAQTGGSRSDRMVNQRYSELDGKTIKEWMSEQDETDMARERRQRLQSHKKGN